MHSGFGALRNAFCCNFVAKYEGNIPVSEDAKKDVARIVEIWGQARKAVVERGVEDEGFLCGEFGVVDAFFWPVLWVSWFLLCSFTSLLFPSFQDWKLPLSLSFFWTYIDHTALSNLRPASGRCGARGEEVVGDDVERS